MIKCHYTGLSGAKGPGGLPYDCFCGKQPPLQEKELVAFFTSSEFRFRYVVLKQIMWPMQETPVIINNKYEDKRSNQSSGSQLGGQHCHIIIFSLSQRLRQVPYVAQPESLQVLAKYGPSSTDQRPCTLYMTENTSHSLTERNTQF